MLPYLSWIEQQPLTKKEPVRGISNSHSGECYIGEYLREMKISYDNTEAILQICKSAVETIRAQAETPKI